MTIIRVGLTTGKSKTMEIDKPFDEIHGTDILDKGVTGRIVGWIDVEEETRQSRKQLYEQSDHIDELKAENRQLKSTIAIQQATIGDIGRDSRDTNIALNESRKIALEYHKKYNSLVGILDAVKEQDADTIGKLGDTIDLLKARVWDAENINIMVAEHVDRTHPDWRSNVMKGIANVVGNIPVGTEITKNGTAATLIDYGKKLDEYETTIEDLKNTIKTNAEVSHADMGRKDGWIEELREERDKCKNTVAVLLANMDGKITIDGFIGTVEKLNDEIDELKAQLDEAIEDMYKARGERNIAVRSHNEHLDQVYTKIEYQCKMLADYEKAVQRLIDSNKDDRSTIDELKATNAELYNEIAVDDQTIDGQKTFINRLLYSNKEFNIVLDNVRRDVKDRDKHIKDLEYDLLLYKRSNTAKDKLIAKQYKSLIDFWNARNDLKQTVIEKDDRINELNDLLTEVTLRETSRTDGNDVWHTPTQQMRATIKEMQKERDDLKKIINELNKQIDRWQEDEQ